MNKARLGKTYPVHYQRKQDFRNPASPLTTPSTVKQLCQPNDLNETLSYIFAIN